MRLRGARPFWMGLAASALLHAGLLSTGLIDLPVAPTGEETAPLEVQLEERAPLPAELARPQARVEPAARPLPRPRVLPAEAAQVLSAAAVPETPTGQNEVAEPAAAGEAIPSAALPAAEASADEPLAPLNPLPRRIDMEYRVSFGPAAGRQTLLWVNEGERYTVTSVAAATGLTSLFYSGRFVQTSRGLVTPRGLQPEAFWDQRGDKHSFARFDTASGSLTLNPAKGAPRHFTFRGEVQDALSLLFQLALTAPPPDGQLAYTVFNGKKLRDYTYEVRGEEVLDTVLGALRTLHLARVGGEGRFEVWLAIDRHYLPVRVVRVEDSGAEGELTIASIRVPE